MRRALVALFVCLGVAAALGVVLQVLWLRARLTQLQAMRVDAGSRRAAADGSGLVALYSVVVDADATARLNDASRPYYDAVRDLLPARQFVLPHVCGGDARQRPVAPSKRGVLVLRRSPGAAALAEDVRADRVRYLVANGHVLLVHYDEEASRALLATLPGAEAEEEAFVLYAVEDDAAAAAAAGACRVSLKPFMGSTALADAQDSAAMDVGLVLGLTGRTDDAPMQLVAYAT